MLKRNKRIHGRSTVEHIVKEGERTPGRLFATIKIPNDAASNRYAVIVGKKLEKSSAKRNRKRRQFYEALRLLEKNNPVPKGPFSDIVLLARHAALKADFSEIQDGLSPLFRL